MKVADLIRVLTAMDPEAVVVVPGYELGVDGVDRVEAVRVELNAQRWAEGVFVGKEALGEMYEGSHKLDDHGVAGVLIASTRHEKDLNW